jgi:hypothetical protein
MGLVGTMAALLLSLLVASAKSSYDAQGAQLTQMAATVGLLDRALVVYGPEAKEERELLRATVIRMLDQMWSRDGAESSTSAPTTAGGEGLYTRIQNLSPATDRQRKVQDQALGFATDVGRMRWLMYEQATVTISTPLLVALIVWLTISFVSFGLTSPCNATVLTGFFLSVLSVSSAIFLILEMYSPYTGLLQISRAPLQAALLHLGR